MREQAKIAVFQAAVQTDRHSEPVRLHSAAPRQEALHSEQAQPRWAESAGALLWWEALPEGSRRTGEFVASPPARQPQRWSGPELCPGTAGLRAALAEPRRSAPRPQPRRDAVRWT